MTMSAIARINSNSGMPMPNMWYLWLFFWGLIRQKSFLLLVSVKSVKDNRSPGMDIVSIISLSFLATSI
jgi:hypothetical protein